MDALELIQADVARIRTSGPRRAALVALVCSLSIGLGVGLRRDLIGLDSALAVVAIALTTGAVAALATLADGRRFVAPAVIVLLLAVTGRWLGGGMPIPYPTPAIFWAEVTTCVVKGLGTTVLAAVIASVFVARVLPLANRATLKLLATLPSGAGLLMLTVHCPSDDLGHLALGHWLVGLLFYPVSFVVLRALVRRALAPVVARPGLRAEARDFIVG